MISVISAHNALSARRWRRWSVLTLSLALATAPTLFSAAAQTVQSAQSAWNIEMDAASGIEWSRNVATGEGSYRASGGVRVARGDATVRADTIVAFYRRGASSGQDVYRFEASGTVCLERGGAVACGQHGVYDLAEGMFVLTGAGLRLESPDLVVTATEALEFWDRTRIAIARGDAKAVRGDRTLSADQLTAFFAPSADATTGGALLRVEGAGHVVLTSPNQVARGDEGAYDAAQESATLCGAVRITRGPDQLEGACALLDLRTGRSVLTGGARGVRGLLTPRQKQGS